MSAAAAYAEAQRLIAEAQASGATKLDLDTDATHALTTLPPEIGALTDVTILSLSNTQITNLTALTGLKTVATLDISFTRLTDFTPLSQLTALTSLVLTSTKVKDLAPLSQLIDLTTLDLSFNPFTDLAPLTELAALAKLDLSFTRITNLAPLNQLTDLSTLYLDDTRVTDPRPLVDLTKLATRPELGGLTFTGTPFAAYPEFAGIAEIEDPAERAQRLFAALEGWVPPVPQDSHLAPSYTVPEFGPITSGDDPPEGGDPGQEELRQDLMRKSALLVASIGNSNELAVLKGAAQHYHR